MIRFVKKLRSYFLEVEACRWRVQHEHTRLTQGYTSLTLLLLALLLRLPSAPAPDPAMLRALV